MSHELYLFIPKLYLEISGTRTDIVLLLVAVDGRYLQFTCFYTQRSTNLEHTMKHHPHQGHLASQSSSFILVPWPVSAVRHRAVSPS